MNDISRSQEARKLYNALSVTLIPQRMHDGIVRYITHRIAPGHFLSAVIQNDLKQACSRADDENRHLLWEYVVFFYNHAPMGCWGSVQKFDDWLKGSEDE